MLKEFARLVDRTTVYRDIDQQVTQYRGHVREYGNATASARWLCGEARNQPSAHLPITT
jgi:hypothetical protein